MKQQFKKFKFKSDTLELIARAVKIIQDLSSQGYTLTLRQLYYQLVSKDVIENKQSEYKRLGSILNDARLAGIVDWSSIEDRTRNLESVSHWDSPADIIATDAACFRLDKWSTQPHRVEVWVEKDALVGVIESACRKLDVAWFSCRGYTSQSELYSAGIRLGEYADRGQTPIVIHLGDHDPSGIDMTRDITERLELFAQQPIIVERIALNMDQIERFNPPPNPAKITDSRFESYQKIHGEESWELDALDPRFIEKIIADKVQDFRDDDLFEEQVEIENEYRNQLRLISRNWGAIEEFVSKLK